LPYNFFTTITLPVFSTFEEESRKGFPHLIIALLNTPKRYSGSQRKIRLA